MTHKPTSSTYEHKFTQRPFANAPAKSLAALALALPIAVSAQTTTNTPSVETNATSVATNTASVATNVAPAVSAGLVNDWLRQQSTNWTPWDLGGQFRARLEVKDYFDTFGQPGQVAFRKEGGDPNNTYLLMRARVHAGYNSPWFGIYLEGQESSSTGDKRNPNVESDLFDLHQGYATIGNLQEFPLQLKGGRQAMDYGDQRLIGSFDWNNIGRTFDAIKLHSTPGDTTWVDAFVGHVVIPKDNQFDYPNNYDTFSGVYASTHELMPWQETQVYFLARNASEQAPNFTTGALVPLPSPRDIYTPGFRFKSLPGKLEGFDYGVEADYQFGRYETVTGTAPGAVPGADLSQKAYLGHLDGGYTWEMPWSPRVGAEFNYASGDKNASDGTHGTFDTLYPTTHMVTGIMDLYCLQNIEDARINLTVKPTKKFTAFTSFRGVWLATTSDSFYQANQTPRTGGTPGAGNGYAINPTYNRFVGTEADLVLTYNFTSYAQLQGGYGHFFVGDYIRQSLSAPGFGYHDADYIYLQGTLNF
jgi:hypothetical protein